MQKTYNSLMLGSEGDKVTWTEEWDKALQAQKHLSVIVDKIPTVRFVARLALQNELQRRKKAVDLDKVYINVISDDYQIERRPSGTLVDVLIYCLDTNTVPNYLGGEGDGVYYLPDTFSDKFRVAGFSIVDVESVVTATLGSFEASLRSELNNYWAAPATDSSGQAGMTNQQEFKKAYAQMLAAELSLAVMTMGIREALASRYSDLLSMDSGDGVYRAVVVPEQEYLTARGPSIILDNAARTHSQMNLLNDNTDYVLHTPDKGFEFFASNLQLHKELLSRLGVSDTQVKYPKVTQGVFSLSAGAHLQGQLETLSILMHDRGRSERPLTEQLQENQSLFVLLSDIELRLTRVFDALRRLDWPLWLLKSTHEIQRRYIALEDSKNNYDTEYQAVFDSCFSFQEHVRRAFSDWTNSAFGEPLDSEKIEVHSLYSMQVGGRTIEQEDTRTLTEFIAFGLHDEGFRAKLTIKGAPVGSRLSVAALEQWLVNRNMRLQFTANIPAAPSREFQQAYWSHLYSKMELALFIAHQSGYYSDADAEIIQRAMGRDPSVFIRGVKLEYLESALKDVIVFNVRESQAYFIFLRTSAGAFEFIKFANAFDMKKWFESSLGADRDYAASLIRPDALQDAGILQGANRAPLRYEYKIGTRHAELFNGSIGTLFDYINVAYQNEVVWHKAIAPNHYGQLGVEGRRRYARLHTELRAISTIEARENGFPSFEKFTYDAVKEVLQLELGSRQVNVNIDPDLIIVQAESFRRSLTDLLIEGLSFETSHPSFATKFDPYYYMIGGHPEIKELDIRDLSQLSKTFRPGDRYTEMLKGEYLKPDRPDYAFRRAVYAKKIHCQMHYDAVSGFVDGKLSNGLLIALQRIIDRVGEGRGNENAVHSILDEGLYKLHINTGLTDFSSRFVEGAYIFRIKNGNGFLDLMYTPDAPDRVSFRAVKDFFTGIQYRLSPFREYYLDRLQLIDKEVVDKFFNTTMAKVDAPAPIKPYYPGRVSDLRELHTDRIRRVLNDIDEKTTSLTEVITGLIYENVIRVANIVSILVPPVGTVVVAVQLMKSLYDGAHAYQRGDYSAALGHGKEALIGLFTLGKASAAGGAAKKVTSAQRTFLSIVGDARTAAQFVTETMGLKTPDQQLIDFLKELIEDQVTSRSKTSVR
ncbi:hypothetical protein ATI02_2069 [Pseudomonas baetica]|uniref:Uncharacterized protein n=1 Tax=Pseudomonas baetica TaxID=674054 RepID=A0ABX4PXZ6_9PSED|nr:DUF6543 domain-containing protein [Pseudomonas baetica]PKA69236.1 hypothetical protein ATI02_2069 [Pseudomonas baetica]PTC20949.1 hypothetical protein C0J26_05505 [Pseudomonas baetica]